MLEHHRSGRARLGHALYLLVAYELYLRVLEDAAEPQLVAAHST